LLFSTDSNAIPGTPVCITAIVTPSIPDHNLSNDTLTACFEVRDSHDPNLKEVYPTSLTQNADWLTYTIHFQNTGNDTAYLVVLKDTLSQYVDAASFQYLASSHHAVIQLDHNAMTFTFPHINLVDSATNPPLSEGWIQYRVKANANLPNGTAINNTAYIYFDNNAAVVTNTATTNVAAATCADTIIPVTHSKCSGDTFTFYGHQLTTQGTYNDTMPRAGGCDSIISLTLTVHPRYISPAAHDTICAGSSLSYHGQTLTSAGTYTATLQSIYGCDSIVSVVLAIRPSDMTMLEDTICHGSTYSFHGQTLSTAGMYMDTLQNMHGCDSVIMLMLEVRQTERDTINEAICNGTAYTFLGQSLTSPGIYYDTLNSLSGCDSIIVLNLSIHPYPSLTLSWQSMVQQNLLGAASPDTVWCGWWPSTSAISGGSPTGGHYSGTYVQNDSFHFPSSHPQTTDTIAYIYIDPFWGCTYSVTNTLELFVLCEVGINEIENLSDIKLYPNPNTGTFTLTTSNSHKLDYTITNMLGDVIEQKTITADTQTIDMGYAAAGVYTLYVKGARPVRFTVVR
jgi:uncharacterized repeat protein (TIGR01451 family)